MRSVPLNYCCLKRVGLDKHLEKNYCILHEKVYLTWVPGAKEIIITCYSFSSVPFASIIVSVHSHASSLHYQACLYYIIPF